MNAGHNIITENTIKIYGLGPLTIEYNTNVIKSDDWDSRKALKLFALFIINKNKSIDCDEIIDYFWRDISLEQGKKRLYNTIYLLRRNIGRKDIIVKESSGYRFNKDINHWFDWDEFDNIYIRLKKTENNEKFKMLNKALELYRGDLISELKYEDWLESSRVNYREKYLNILYDISEELYRENKLDKALFYLKEGIEKDSFRENFYKLLMKILAEQGRSSEAIKIFKNYCRLLKDELGVNPGDKLVNEYRKIKSSDDLYTEVMKNIEDKGALQCSVDVFNKIYELEKRKLARSKDHFSVLIVNFDSISTNINIDELANEITALFRAGDVLCYFNNKIHILFHGTSLEKSSVIIKRICNLLDKYNISEKPIFEWKEI